MSAAPGAPTIRLSQDAEADALLARSPFALLVGMVLDHQIPMEQAFAGPAKISERIGRELNPAEVAEYDPQQFASVLSQPPAVHRFPVAMAERIQQLAAHLTETYGGEVTRMWTDSSTGAEVVRRFEQLPGFGRPKARKLLALLGKQLGVHPLGWREAAAPYGEEGAHLSVADVVDQASLAAVRAAKRERKQARKRAAAAASGSAPEGFVASAPGKKKAPKRAARRTDRASSALSHVIPGSGVTGVRTAR